MTNKISTSLNLYWLLKGKYSYSQSEYELVMGKEEAPFVDTDINFIVNILTRAMTSSPYCVIMTSLICSI